MGSGDERPGALCGLFAHTLLYNDIQCVALEALEVGWEYGEGVWWSKSLELRPVILLVEGLRDR